MLGLNRGIVLGLVAAGFVSPGRGPRNEYRFSFQDVVLLRTAYELRQAQIAPRRILRSLRQLRAHLPCDLPMSGLRIRAVGNHVAVHEAGAAWEAGSGQLLLDLDLLPGPAGEVVVLSRQPGGDDAAQSAYQSALTLDEAGSPDAEHAYVRALELKPDLLDAYVNLGAWLCERQRFADAVALYEQSTGLLAQSALLRFNHAVALESLGDASRAIGAYLECLNVDSDFHDAHYNVALLYEAAGDRQAALRHFSAYRRATRESGPG